MWALCCVACRAAVRRVVMVRCWKVSCYPPCCFVSIGPSKPFSLPWVAVVLSLESVIDTWGGGRETHIFCNMLLCLEVRRAAASLGDEGVPKGCRRMTAHSIHPACVVKRDCRQFTTENCTVLSTCSEYLAPCNFVKAALGLAALLIKNLDLNTCFS